MVSQGTKDLVADGAWARNGTRRTPEAEGLTRDQGWTEDYEQLGTGSLPDRGVFNQQWFEQTSAIVDVVGMGVPVWDATLDYTVTDDAVPFVTTSSGLWRLESASGPGHGGAVDPEAEGQDAWRRY